MANARDTSLSPEKQIDNLVALSQKPPFQIHQDTLGLLFYYITYRCYNINDQDKTIHYAGEAIKAFEAVGYEGYQLAKSYLLRAYTHHLLDNTQKAQSDLVKIIDELIISGRSFDSLWRAVLKRATNFKSAGEYESSIHFLNTFIQSDRFHKIGNLGKATLYRELSIAHSMYDNRNRLLKAKQINDKAAIICDSLDHTNIDQFEQVILNLMHKAYIDWELDDRLSAIDQYEQALALMAAKPDYHYINRLTTNCLINIARIKIELDMCPNALGYIQRAKDLHLDKGKQYYNELKSGIGIVAGEYYLCQKNYNSAISEIQKTKDFLLKGSKLYSIQNLRSYPHKELLINNLNIELKVLSEVSNRMEQNQLDQLKNKTLQLDSLVDFYLEDMYFNSSKIELKSELDKFYKLALDISFESNDLEKFWFYSEKRSNLLLLKNEKENSINDSTTIDLEASLSSLRREASHIENQMYKLTEDQKLKYDSLNNKLVKINSEQLKILESRSKSGSLSSKRITTLSEFKSNISTTKTWVNYQFGTEDLYALKLDEDELKLFNLGPSSLIKEKIKNWFSNISKKQDNTSDIVAFGSDSEFLYQSLIKPLGELNSNIIVIPDEELYYLSFDALKASDGKYLIEKYNISYDLSSTLANHHRIEKRKSVKNISIFLPSYEGSEYSSLEHASQDYNSLLEMHGVSLFEKDQTTKPNFIRSLEESDIVHFGGHALHIDENNQYSHLAMMTSDQETTNMISLGDLYSLDVNSKLVALPACNTGMGSLLQGEGISNLTRGFFYAGAETVISSLWDVDDKSTSIIMNQFYVNLKEGVSKSEALRLSKLQYLDSSPDFLKHPNLWSGLILTGSDKPMSFASTSLNIILLCLAGLVLLALCFKTVQSKVTKDFNTY